MEFSPPLGMRAHSPPPISLEHLLDDLEGATEERYDVSLGTILEIVGERSFGPILLVCGLIAVSPLSGIPGMPTTIGTLVILIAAQLLAGREHLWLPHWVLRRKVSQSRFKRALERARKVARAADRVVRPRWMALTSGPGLYAVAGLCLVTAATMPPLEVVPFAATLAGAVLVLFGVALTVRDGLVGLLGVLGLAGGGALALSTLLG